jgi:elongation factor G
MLRSLSLLRTLNYACFKAVRSCGNIASIRNVGIIAHVDAGKYAFHPHKCYLNNDFSGKTTTTEHILYKSGFIKDIGRVDDGNSVMDFLPQERERGITISSAAIVINWKDTSINIIDTPGHVDFMIEVERSVRVMDSAVVIIDAVAGVQAQTRTVWKQAERRSLPAVIFVNKMDREGASLSYCLSSLKEKLRVNAVPIQLPVVQNDTFVGIVDLLTLRQNTWQPGSADESGWQDMNENDAMYAEAVDARRQMLEDVADVDEAFMELYLSQDLDIPEKTVQEALAKACRERKLFPVLCGSSLKGKGTEPLLDAIVSYLPSPIDRDPFPVLVDDANTEDTFSSDKDLYALAFKVIHDSARGKLVFVRVYSGSIVERKTLFNSSKKVKDVPNQVLNILADTLVQSGRIDAGNIGCIVGLKHTSTGDTLVMNGTGQNHRTLTRLAVPPTVFSVALEPEKSSQQPDLEKALAILCLEDPSLHYELDGESGQTLIRGLGELHLDIVCDKLKRQFNIEVRQGEANVAYRESIDPSETPKTFTHTLDRSIGGSRMFAAITMTLSPSGDLTGNSIHFDKEMLKQLSPQERYALTDGMEACLSAGVKGYPLVGLRIEVTDVVKDSDTTEGAVRACVVGSMHEAMKQLRHVYLEPVMSIEAELPDEYLGDTLSDLSVKRRAMIKDVTSLPFNFSSIVGTVPLATMLGYATSIRSMTHGQGSFSMEYVCHQPVDNPLI